MTEQEILQMFLQRDEHALNAADHAEPCPNTDWRQYPQRDTAFVFAVPEGELPEIREVSIRYDEIRLAHFLTDAKYPLRGCYYGMGASIAGPQALPALCTQGNFALCGVRRGRCHT